MMVRLFSRDAVAKSPCTCGSLPGIYKKIVIHEKEVKWSKHAPQTVEIYYNGIGYVGSGQQDAEETPEAPDPLQTQDTEKPRQAS